MSQSAGLLLKEPNLLEKIVELFDKLKTNTGLQSEFVNSPDRVFNEVGLCATKSEGAAEAIQFLFSVLTSEKLQNWLRQYEENPRGEVRSRETIFRDLAGVFVEFGKVSHGLNNIASFDDPGIWWTSSISRTYVKTLNNSTTFITKIKSDTDDPPQRGEIAALEVVNLAERVVQLGKSSPESARP